MKSCTVIQYDNTRCSPTGQRAPSGTFPNDGSQPPCQRKDQKVREVVITPRVLHPRWRSLTRTGLFLHFLLTSCRPSFKFSKIFSECTRVRQALKQRRETDRQTDGTLQKILTPCESSIGKAPKGAIKKYSYTDFYTKQLN